MIHFKVNASPVSQPRQRHRIAGKGKRRFVQNYTPTKDKSKTLKKIIIAAAKSAYWDKPMKQPIHLTLTFGFQRPKDKIWKRKAMNRYFHTSAPDIDNLSKLVMDALNGIIWHDDSYIARLDAKKIVISGEESPFIEVSIVPLSDQGSLF